MLRLLNRSQYRYAQAWSEEGAGMLRDMSIPGLKKAQGCYGYLIEASTDMPKPGLKKAQGCYEICPCLV